MKDVQINSNPSIRLSKDAVSTLGIFIWFIGAWDLVVLISLFLGDPTDDLLLTVVLNALLVYLLTEDGYKKLKTILAMGIKGLLWILPWLLLGGLAILFFQLPPTTIIIVLLIAILLKR